MSRARNLVGSLLALACVGALLHPAAAHAKATKRGRGVPRRPPGVTGAEGAERTSALVRAKRSTRHASARRHFRIARHGTRGSVDDHVHVRKGDTLESLLAARGVGITEAREWIASTVDVFDLTKIRPRHGLTLRFDRETHALESIRYEIDGKNLLVAELAGDGITSRREDLPYFVEVKGIAGRITHGLRDDIVGAGVPARIAADLADIFGWDVDVETGLHSGDEYRVIYENIWQVGMSAPQAGKVLAAELVVGDRRETALLFENEDGEGGYYRPSGDAISRIFLRYPVEFTEISSGFSLERFHPIRREVRPHWGVDFAATYGTPVRAAANGVVSTAGWEVGLGNTVRIDHPDAVASVYGHLAQFAFAVAPGASVERGQVIGYVGSTGLSTGPHLHYEITRNGAHTDPLEFTCEREPSVGPLLTRQFERARREATKQLAAIPGTTEPTSLSLSTTLFQASE